VHVNTKESSPNVINLSEKYQNNQNSHNPHHHQGHIVKNSNTKLNLKDFNMVLNQKEMPKGKQNSCNHSSRKSLSGHNTFSNNGAQKLNKAIIDFLKSGKPGTFSNNTVATLITGGGGKKGPISQDKNKNYIEDKNNYYEPISKDYGINSKISEATKHPLLNSNLNAKYIQNLECNKTKNLKRKDLKGSNVNPFKKFQSVHNIRDKAAMKSVVKFSSKKASLPGVGYVSG
jgi:hypothetical protein